MKHLGCTRYLFLLFLTGFLRVHAQVLDLPPRGANALTGTQLAAVLAPLLRAEREERIFSEVTWGNVPDFLRSLVPVTSSASVGGGLQSVTYYVTPDYFAIGSDADYFLIPMTPLLAQRIADATGTILPSRKMVNDIYAAAEVKLAPAPISPSDTMTTVPVFAQHNSMVWTQRSEVLGFSPLGSLVGGTKKDVVVSNKIRNDLRSGVPKPVVIYGWHRLDGTPIQPLYNGHGETYADYSHGIRLIRDSVQLSGVSRTITSILTDPVLYPLLSDEGVISVPRYGEVPTGVEHGGHETPRESFLFQNYPNPFNPETSIRFEVSSASPVRLAVHDLLGRQLTVLVDKHLESGVYSVRYDGTGLSSGVYICRFTTPDRQTLRKMVLSR